MHRVHRPWRIHVLIILVYTLMALCLTWPLVGRIASHVPGDGADDPPLTWNLWWVRHALLEQGTNPFDCDAIFYPIGINLAFYTLTILNGLLSVPLQGVSGLIPASNMLLLSSFILSGYGAFLLTRYVLARTQRSPDGTGLHVMRRQPAAYAIDVPAFIGGLFYAFASNKLFYAALGQWNIASSQWIPFYILYLLRLGDPDGNPRHAVMASAFLLFQAYAEMTYATFLVLFTALWLVWRLPHFAALWRSKALGGSLLLRRCSLNLVILALVFLIGLLPVLVMMIPELRAEGDIFVEGGGFADVFSADLLGFLVPTMHHPLFGGLVERFSFDYQVGQHLYMGYSVMFLAVVSLVITWRFRAVKFWSLSALVFWLLTLGPTLRVNGHSTSIPMPFSLVSRLPFFNGNRYPSRYSVLLILSLAILAAFAMRAVAEWAGRSMTSKERSGGTARRRPRPVVVLAFLAPAAFFLLEHLSAPLPLSDMRIPPVYEAITESTPQSSTLLDIPVAWRNGFRVTGTADTIIMFAQYYQTYHGRHLLAGNTSRNPALKFQYFTEAPVINTLIALETGHQIDPAIIEEDRSLAAAVLQFFGVSAVAVHPAQAGPDVISYVESTMPVERIYEDETSVAFTVAEHSLPETWTVVPGEWTGRLGFVEGWGAQTGGVVWAQRRADRILVLLNGERQEMAFRAYAPVEGQTLRLEVNGHLADRIELRAGWADYQVTLPGEVVLAGLNEIWLRFDFLYPASQGTLSSRNIGETGTLSPCNIVVQSAGLEVGDIAAIHVDGRDVSPNHRGYNVAVIGAESGDAERTASFDTHLEEGASRDLAAFLSQVPPGSIVAVSVADEASRLLGVEAVDALRTIGAQGDLQGRFRWGHAVIGVKGAAPGTAVEALGWMRPITLAVGDGVTEGHLAAAFGPIAFAARTQH